MQDEIHDTHEKSAQEKGVDAVDRALSILRAFEEGQKTLSLHEIAQATGLYKSTILRLIASLEKFGYIRREDLRYQLGPACARLAQLYNANLDLSAMLREAVRDLSAESGETASFYIRDGEERVCVVRQNSSRAIRHHVDEGARLPLDRGAAGLVILAYAGGDSPRFETVRRDGYAITLGEREPDAAAIAMPLFDAEDRFLGALCISGLRSRFTSETIEKLRGLLQDRTRQVERELGRKTTA
ncbi:IclR family transcriptional regulator [Microvirga sp. 2TAF3]|uniref:IclR family transcriptional regulator n=1 Tax=Microvirga sp. 2TAF3 TaxID=3233014 RepID=UPI003F963EF2